MIIMMKADLSWGSEGQNNYFVNCGHFPQEKLYLPKEFEEGVFWSVLGTNIHMKGTEMELLVVHSRPEDYPVYSLVSAQQSQLPI